MKITVNNYESFFLDYHEGTLSAEDSAELLLFLEQHPQLKEEFESFENISLSTEPSFDSYPDKESLKKITFPDITNIDEWLIAELEGDLTLQQRTLLLTFLAENPSYLQHRNLFKKSVVDPDMTLVFPAKAQLRKRFISAPSSGRNWYYAAASVILLLGAWFAFRMISPDHTPDTADKNPVTIPADTIIKKDAEVVPQKNLAQKTSTVNSSENKNDTSTNEEKSAQDLKEKNKLQDISPDKHFASTSPDKKDAQKQNSIKDDLHLTAGKIDFLNPKLAGGITEDVPFVFAERRYIPSVQLNNITKEENIANVQEKVITEIKDFAANNVNKATGEELLATKENNPKLPLKSRFIRLAGSLIGKATGDKVKVKTAFDPINGNFAAYELEMGKNKWQKQF